MEGHHSSDFPYSLLYHHIFLFTGSFPSLYKSTVLAPIFKKENPPFTPCLLITKQDLKELSIFMVSTSCHPLTFNPFWLSQYPTLHQNCTNQNHWRPPYCPKQCHFSVLANKTHQQHSVQLITRSFLKFFSLHFWDPWLSSSVTSHFLATSQPHLLLLLTSLLVHVAQPQGSVLRPFVCLIYMHPLNDPILSHGFKYHVVLINVSLTLYLP